MSVSQTSLDTLNPSQQQTYVYNPQSQMQGGQTVEMMEIETSVETINTAAERGMNSNPLSQQQPQPSSLSNAVELWNLMRRNELSQSQPQSSQELTKSNAPDEDYEGYSSEELVDSEEECPPQEPVQILPRRLTSVRLQDGKLMTTSSDGTISVQNFDFELSPQLDNLQLHLPQNEQHQEKLSLGFGDGAITITTLQAINNEQLH